jgi:hypothetical protein
MQSCMLSTSRRVTTVLEISLYDVVGFHGEFGSYRPRSGNDQEVRTPFASWQATVTPNQTRAESAVRTPECFASGLGTSRE